MKKGILLPNLISIIIVAIAAVIILLPLLLSRLQESNEKENARILLNRLEGAIENLEDGVSTPLDMQGFAKISQNTEWILTAWGKNSPDRPQECFFQSCIYLCQKESSNLPKDCSENGVRRRIDIDNIQVIVKQEIISQTNTFAGEAQESSTIAEYNYIKIPENLFEIKLTKTGNTLKIESELPAETINNPDIKK